MANEYLGERPTKAVLGDVCPHCGHIYVEGEDLHQHGRRRAVAALAAFLAAVSLNGCVSLSTYREGLREAEFLGRTEGISDLSLSWSRGYGACEADHAEAIKAERENKTAEIYRRARENVGSVKSRVTSESAIQNEDSK